MAVKNIIDRNLTIPLEAYPQVAQLLGPLDRDHDGSITFLDFYKRVTPPPAGANYFQLAGFFCESLLAWADAKDAMHAEVANALMSGGLITETQAEGLTYFFDLYNDVLFFESRVQDWDKNKVNSWGRELEFDATYWDQSVKYYLDSFDIKSSNNLKLRIYNVLGHLLNYSDHISPSAFDEGCGGIISVTITSNYFPTCISPFAQEILEKNSAMQAMLASYDQIECDGDGCSPSDDGNEIDLSSFIIEGIVGRYPSIMKAVQHCVSYVPPTPW